MYLVVALLATLEASALGPFALLGAVAGKVAVLTALPASGPAAAATTLGTLAREVAVFATLPAAAAASNVVVGVPSSCNAMHCSKSGRYHQMHTT